MNKKILLFLSLKIWRQFNFFVFFEHIFLWKWGFHIYWCNVSRTARFFLYVSRNANNAPSGRKSVWVRTVFSTLVDFWPELWGSDDKNIIFWTDLWSEHSTVSAKSHVHLRHFGILENGTCDEKNCVLSLYTYKGLCNTYLTSWPVWSQVPWKKFFKDKMLYFRLFKKNCMPYMKLKPLAWEEVLQ